MRYALGAGVLALGLTLTACTGDNPGSRSATDTASAAGAGMTLTFGPSAGRCDTRIEPEHLKGTDAAFEGTVTSVTVTSTEDIGRVDAVVTMKVTHTFLGEPGETVRLLQDGADPDSHSYNEGQSYLITAGEGDVVDCLSGTSETEYLAEAYQKAFGKWR